MRRIWAVSRETFLECIRTRAMALFLAFLAGCILAMTLMIEGDGTLKGRIQTFLSYSLALVQLVLGVLTVGLTTWIITSDIRRKSIFILVAKPLPRWQYIVGRFVGVAMLDAAILAGCVLAIYASAEYLRGLPTQIERQIADGLQKPGTPDPDRMGIESQVFAARDKHVMDAIDVNEVVQRRVQALVEEQGPENLVRNRLRGLLQVQAGREGKAVDDDQVDQLYRDNTAREKAWADIQQDLYRQASAERYLVPPGRDYLMRFSHLKTGLSPRDTLQLRYRLYPTNPPGSGTMRSSWIAVNPTTNDLRVLVRTEPTESTTTVDIPPDVVGPDGKMELRYINETYVQREPTLVKIRPDEITILYRTGSFEANLVRAGLLILLGTTFLTAISILAATILSFPLACLACLWLCLLAFMGDYSLESSRILGIQGIEYNVFHRMAYHLTRAVYAAFLPNLSQLAPGSMMVDGMNISLSRVAGECLLGVGTPTTDSWTLWQWMGVEINIGVGLKALAMLATGMLIFRRRELARVQV